MTPLDEWKASARYFVVAGQRIAYWASGDTGKPVLLLIHGFPTSSWDWSAVWPRLEPHFRLVAMDMLGFGLSDKPREAAYSIFAQADLQEVFLVELGVGEAHILAHDYGDTVAQELLARANEGKLSFVLRSVCFLNGGLFPETHRARPLQKLALTPLGPLVGLFMTRRSLKGAFDKIYGPLTKPSRDEIEGHWRLLREKGGRRILHKLMRYIPERRANRARWVGGLKAARIPMRLIDGGADPVSGAHMLRRYRQEVPDADAVLLETVGHYPQTEAPVAVVKAFLDFHKRIGTIA